MSGLDEAVEAMARALWDEFGSQPCGQRKYERARRILAAALPAGVYRSDGQGKVECLSQDAMREAMTKRQRHWGSKRDQAAWIARELLDAALSATDTEGTA